MFDYSLYETEKRIEAIVDAYSKCRGKGDACEDPERCEAILREGLKNYPGNDILLNCLICTIPIPQRAEEVIGIGKQLVQSTRRDEIRIDAYRMILHPDRRNIAGLFCCVTRFLRCRER